MVITQWKLERNAIHMDVYIDNLRTNTHIENAAYIVQVNRLYDSILMEEQER